VLFLPDPLAQVPVVDVAPPDPLLGRALAGKYRLEKLLGEGGMGAVYRARQLALDKVVAVKVMHKELAADPTFAARFHREAKAASRLDHQNSIRILDFGEETDGLLYISMEFLDGRDLLAIIQHEPALSPLRIVDLLSQVLGALSVAHEMGIIHRDLKPENIMVLRSKGEDGTDVDVVKVCDFGIAKVTEGAEVDEAPMPTRARKGKLTTAGLVIGTPEYMSPEQGRGEPLDPRSDLYSVGVILYYLLSGRPPFDAPTPLGIVVKHQSEEPVPPSSIRPGVDPGLERVCLKAMSKRPADRYASAKELRTALRDAVGQVSTVQLSAAHARTELQMAAVPRVALTAGMPAETSAAVSSAIDLAPRKARSWKTVGVVAVVALLAGGGGGGLLLYPRLFATHDGDTLRSDPPHPPSKPAAPPSSAAPVVAAPLPAVSAVPVSSVSLTAGHTGLRPARPDRGASAAQRSSVLDNPTVLPGNAAALPPSLETPANALPVAPGPPPAPPGPASPEAPPPPKTAPGFDFRNARVTLGSPKIGGGSLTPGAVSKAMRRVSGAVEACFHTVPFSSCWSGGTDLHIETDENGTISRAYLSGSPIAGLDGCIRSAVSPVNLRSDEGATLATIPLSCAPN